MELAAPIWDAIKCFCDCTTKQAAFICHMEDSLQSLTEQWTWLQKRSEDVNQMVQLAESNPRMGRTQVVDHWLQEVNDFQTTVEGIQNRGAKVVQDKCLGNYCHKNCLSSYKLGRKVVKTLDRVNQLMTEGERFNSTNIASELPRSPAEEMPVPSTVGMDEMINKVCDSIQDPNVGVIGLHGMGGVGKTTLLKRVNNELATRGHDFTLVISVVVSKDRDVEKIIDDISKSIFQSISIDWKDKSKDEKVKEIFNAMKKKKFLLMLDDIWKGLDLHSIGVPPPKTNHSKVLLTTRSENVCDQMQAKKFQVKRLTNEEAFDLFCMKVGEETLNSNPEIHGLARQLIDECKGLPLALITIGRAMAGQNNPQSWMHAINTFRSFPSELQDMEEVFFILKFSYDSLPNDIVRKCFLYLALYPEDKAIFIDEVIHLWIGEGFLGDNRTIDYTFNQGQNLVETLRRACLVEAIGVYRIKLHDVIRDMALWLLRDQDRNKNKILVQEEALKSSESDNAIVEKISIMMDVHHRGTQVWNLPICPHLVSLLMRNLSIINNLENLQFLSELKVLSFDNIGKVITIPKEIGLLINLKYFRLSSCIIEEKFPMEMKNLKSLHVFSLQYIDSSVEIIPLEVIPCLERLRVFRFTAMKNWRAVTDATEELLLEQLESLPHLEDLSIHLVTPAGINKLSSSELQHCVRDVGVAFHAPTVSSMAKWKRLEGICFYKLPNSLEVSLVNHFNICCKLRNASILECHSIAHLTWLKYAPYLRYLCVEGCKLLEEVIMETEDNNARQNMDGIFANLEAMNLGRMPNLRSIYKKALPFPKLETISISNCPNLKKLPFDSNSAKYLKIIEGLQKWWDELEWEDQAIKDLFLPKFKAWPPLSHQEAAPQHV